MSSWDEIEKAVKKAVDDIDKSTGTKKVADLSPLGLAGVRPTAKARRLPKKVNQRGWIGVLYKSRGNDELGLLAEQFYGRKDKWQIIYAFNYAKIGKSPDVLPKNVNLFLPIYYRTQKTNFKPKGFDALRFAHNLKEALNNADDKAGAISGIFSKIAKYESQLGNIDAAGLIKFLNRFGTSVDAVDLVISFIAIQYCIGVRKVIFDAINSQLVNAYSNAVSLVSVFHQHSKMQKADILDSAGQLYSELFDKMMKDHNSGTLKIEDSYLNELIQKKLQENPMKMTFKSNSIKKARFDQMTIFSKAVLIGFFNANRFMKGVYKDHEKIGFPEYTMTEISQSYGKYLFGFMNAALGLSGEVIEYIAKKQKNAHIYQVAKAYQLISLGGDILSSIGVVDVVFGKIEMELPLTDKLIMNLFKGTDQRSILYLSPLFNIEGYQPQR